MNEGHSGGKGGRSSLTHADLELRKVLLGVQRGLIIHPRLADLLIHLGYLQRHSADLHLTIKAYRLVRRRAKHA